MIAGLKVNGVIGTQNFAVETSSIGALEIA
jgi:hypothetical protein